LGEAVGGRSGEKGRRVILLVKCLSQVERRGEEGRGGKGRGGEGRGKERGKERGVERRGGEGLLEYSLR
jgi:hypothetical protein